MTSIKLIINKVRLYNRGSVTITYILTKKWDRCTWKCRSLVWSLMPTTFNQVYYKVHQRLIWSSYKTEIRSLTINNSHSDVLVFFHYNRQQVHHLTRNTFCVSRYVALLQYMLHTNLFGQCMLKALMGLKISPMSYSLLRRHVTIKLEIWYDPLKPSLYLTWLLTCFISNFSQA